MAKTLEKTSLSVLQEVLADLKLSFLSVTHPDEDHLSGLSDLIGDVAVEVGDDGDRRFRFLIEVKSNLLPKDAVDVFHQLVEYQTQHHEDMIPLIFCPRISPRVRELARENGISYLDGATNCWIASKKDNLLISRSGNRHPTGERKQTNLFSKKASRIVRAMLSEPPRGWQVTEFAETKELNVSAGLASKTKNTLVNEGYAYVWDRQLYLHDAAALLRRWCEVYEPPQDRIELYSLGDPQDAEQKLIQWCEETSTRCALSHFSAAWRLAAHVRYNVASAWLETKLPTRMLISQLADAGIKRVETGSNLILYLADDNAVFLGQTEDAAPVVSPLQAYLDLQSMKGRGEDAAQAIYDKHFAEAFAKAKELRNRRVHGLEVNDDG